MLQFEAYCKYELSGEFAKKSVIAHCCTNYQMHSYIIKAKHMIFLGPWKSIKIPHMTSVLVANGISYALFHFHLSKKSSKNNNCGWEPRPQPQILGN